MAISFVILVESVVLVSVVLVVECIRKVIVANLPRPSWLPVFLKPFLHFVAKIGYKAKY